MTNHAADLQSYGYTKIPGVFASSELTKPLSALIRWHAIQPPALSQKSPFLDASEHAAESYQLPFWRPIARRLSAIARRVLGRDVTEIGRQLVGSRLDPVESPLHYAAHIDSRQMSLAQLPKGEPVFSRFDLLAGVYLTDVSDDQSGGLWVWPGSHRRAAALLRKPGSRRQRITGLMEELRPDGDAPCCLHGKAGDVILVHPLLVHASGRNIGPDLAGRLYIRFGAITESADSASQLPREIRECVLRRERSLYTLTERDHDTPLFQRYTRFKLGDSGSRAEFLTELAELVGSTLRPPADPAEWAVVTASTNDLGHEFARCLDRAWGTVQPLGVLNLSTAANLGTDYTDCSLSERIRVARTFFDYDRAIQQRSFVAIDDMITTGTALGTLLQFLAARGVQPTSVYPFAFVRSYFSEPGRERELVDAEVGRLNPADIAAIMNQPGFRITSGTLWRHLANCSVGRRAAVIDALLPTRRALLGSAAASYLGHSANHLLTALQGVSDGN